MIISIVVICIINPPIYSTIILYNGEKYQFDDSYNVYLVDKKYGDLNVEYDAGLEDWALYADFKKAGKTEVVIESPDGKKTIFDISIRRNTYTIEEKNN